MALIPLRDNCYGSVIQSKGNPNSLIINPYPKKIQYIFQVEAVGPDCREINEGDVAVVKEGGAVVTVYDTDTTASRQLFLINEKEILAVLRNEEDATATAG